MNKRVSVNESTEVSIPLKTLIMIISAIVVASWYVSSTYDKINSLESDLALLTERFEAYKTQPGRSSNKMEIIEIEIAHLKQHLEKLEARKK